MPGTPCHSWCADGWPYRLTLGISIDILARIGEVHISQFPNAFANLSVS
jgi:hypothetical protein